MNTIINHILMVYAAMSIATAVTALVDYFANQVPYMTITIKSGCMDVFKLCAISYIPIYGQYSLIHNVRSRSIHHLTQEVKANG